MATTQSIEFGHIHPQVKSGATDLIAVVGTQLALWKTIFPSERIHQLNFHSCVIWYSLRPQVGVTYEQLAALMETVLVETGYYDASGAARRARELGTPPHGPGAGPVAADAIRNGFA